MRIKALFVLWMCCLGFSSYGQQEDFPRVFTGLSFDKPTHLTHSGDGTDRIFVLEQAGKIKVFQNSEEVREAHVFLDIKNKVRSGGEQGLLGLAFHPDFKKNKHFYINYTAQEDGQLYTFVSRFEVSSENPDSALINSEEVILQFEQPYGNHNGGTIFFGLDGYLYISTGDGGGGGDPLEAGQDRSTLLGKILRIDVDNREGMRNYSIPKDNPFAGNTENYKEEIFAYGLRNAWKVSQDEENGLIYAADVGQDEMEIINIIEIGKNYGWNIMEGSLCFEPAEDCPREGLELPVFEYPNRRNDCSITGGYVYRGAVNQSIEGYYVFGDYCSGKVWAIRYNGEEVVDELLLSDTDLQISSFGEDEQNELYICDHRGGGIYRLELENPTAKIKDKKVLKK
ncbi:MAG: PQQ-dependent sugar dehydrogenase [Cytophagaceae bacterium]